MPPAGGPASSIYFPCVIYLCINALFLFPLSKVSGTRDERIPYGLICVNEVKGSKSFI